MLLLVKFQDGADNGFLRLAGVSYGTNMLLFTAHQSSAGETEDITSGTRLTGSSSVRGLTIHTLSFNTPHK